MFDTDIYPKFGYIFKVDWNSVYHLLVIQYVPPELRWDTVCRMMLTAQHHSHMQDRLTVRMFMGHDCHDWTTLSVEQKKSRYTKAKKNEKI